MSVWKRCPLLKPVQPKQTPVALSFYELKPYLFPFSARPRSFLRAFSNTLGWLVGGHAAHDLAGQPCQTFPPTPLKSFFIRSRHYFKYKNCQLWSHSSCILSTAFWWQASEHTFYLQLVFLLKICCPALQLALSIRQLDVFGLVHGFTRCQRLKWAETVCGHTNIFLEVNI